MLAYVIRRMAYGVIVVLGVLFFLFLLFFTVTSPDDVARKALGERVPEAVVEQWKVNHGYDKPLFPGARRLDGQYAGGALPPHADLRLRAQRCGRHTDRGSAARGNRAEPRAHDPALRILARATHPALALLVAFFRETYIDRMGRGALRAGHERVDPALHHRRAVPDRATAALVPDLGLRLPTRVWSRFLALPLVVGLSRASGATCASIAQSSSRRATRRLRAHRAGQGLWRGSYHGDDTSSATR